MIYQYFEIHDDTGPIFKGTANEVIHIWNSMWGLVTINEEYYENFKISNPIKEWTGSLKVFAVFDEFRLEPGKHTREELIN